MGCVQPIPNRSMPTCLRFLAVPRVPRIPNKPLRGCAMDLTEVRILRRGRVLKLTRAENGEVVIKLSGRMDAENVHELETLVSEGAKGRPIVLDLSDLTIVDQDAVIFLKR